MERTKQIFLVLFFAAFSTMLGMGIISPLLPLYADLMGAGGLWLGIIFSAFAISRSLFMPFVGRLSDRRGRKHILMAGLLVYSLISLAYISAENVWTLTLVRFVHGIASAMVVPIAMAIVGDISSVGKEGSVMGSFSVSLFLGVGAGPFIGGLINDSLGFDWVFAVMGLLSFFSFGLTVLFLPPPLEHRTAVVSQSAIHSLTGASRRMQVVTAFTFLIALSRGSLMVFVPIIGAVYGLSSFEVGVLLSANLLLMAVLQLPAGRVADRGRVRLLLIAGSALAAASLMLIPLTGNFWLLFAISCIMGLGNALSQPALMAVTVQEGRTIGMGTAMGIYNTVFGIGMIVAPLMGGAILDYTSPQAVFWFFGAMALLGCGVAALLMDRS
jgi:DHA1 family multidrug resistance protein-like MFS transporter